MTSHFVTAASEPSRACSSRSTLGKTVSPRSVALATTSTSTSTSLPRARIHRLAANSTKLPSPQPTSRRQSKFPTRPSAERSVARRSDRVCQRSNQVDRTPLGVDHRASDLVTLTQLSVDSIERGHGEGIPCRRGSLLGGAVEVELGAVGIGEHVDRDLKFLSLIHISEPTRLGMI